MVIAVRAKRDDRLLNDFDSISWIGRIGRLFMCCDDDTILIEEDARLDCFFLFVGERREARPEATDCIVLGFVSLFIYYLF